MSRNAKAWKLKRALLQNEEPCRANTLQNVEFLKALISDETKTSEQKVIYKIKKNFRSFPSCQYSANTNKYFDRDYTCQHTVIVNDVQIF